MEVLEKKSITNPEIKEDLLIRIDRLTHESTAAWGKMNVAQMLAHVSEVQEVMNGKELKNTPWLAKLFKNYIRKMVTSLDPYPKNSKTHPQYIISSAQEFETQKERAITAINEFCNNQDKMIKTLHPFFGEMPIEDKGWSMYKHWNHHLSQFNV